MRILVVIVSYNFMPWMDRCLGSLRGLDEPADIMVIDNHSSDGTPGELKARYPEVTVVENGANLGFGKANNIGLQRALDEGYDGVLLLNQDAWIDHDTLSKLIAASETHPEFGILSPVHLRGDGRGVERGFATYSRVADLEDLPSEEVVELDFVNAAIWYILQRVLARVGFFAPLFYHYGEDKDLANRMSYYKWKIGYLPGAFGCHAREMRVETRARMLHAAYVYHLTEYANINYSPGRAFAMGVAAVWKKMMGAAVRAAWRDAAAYLAMSARLLGRTCAVVRTRKNAKHVQPNLQS